MEGGGQAGQAGWRGRRHRHKKKGARVTESNAVSTVAAIARFSTTKQGVCVDDHLRPQEHAPPRSTYDAVFSAKCSSRRRERRPKREERARKKYRVEWMVLPKQ